MLFALNTVSLNEAYKEIPKPSYVGLDSFTDSMYLEDKEDEWNAGRKCYKLVSTADYIHQLYKKPGIESSDFIMHAMDYAKWMKQELKEENLRDMIFITNKGGIINFAFMSTNEINKYKSLEHFIVDGGTIYLHKEY